MHIIRATFNVLIVLSTTLVIGFLAFDKLSNTSNQYLIDLILSALHVVYFIGSISNILYYFRIKKFTIVVLLILPFPPRHVFPRRPSAALLAIQCLNEALCFVSSSVLADNFRLRNRQLLVAANR